MPMKRIPSATRPPFAMTPFPFDIDVSFADPAWNDIIGAVDIGRVIDTAWSVLESRKDGELSLAFVDDAAIAELNADYRDKSGPTNVLSFPAGDNPHMLGDIVIARETVMREAQSAGKPLADHITHMLVHGFLHLQGYDHMIDAEAQLMESLETDILAQLGIDNPYEMGKA